MASIYTRKKSPYFWVKYRDPMTGSIRYESTKFRQDEPEGRRKAKQIANEKTRRELEIPRVNASELWQAWVPAYMEQRYVNSPKTRLRAQNAWDALLAYLQFKEVPSPRQVTYQIAADFLKWRLATKPVVVKSKIEGKPDTVKNEAASGLRLVKHNTAVVEVKFFGVIMGEAVRRGFCVSNPCRELEVRRVGAKQKLEIMPADEDLIWRELKKEPQWMRDHFTVVMCQGCRMSEAAVPLQDVDEFAGTIRFRIKGGKYHTAPLHPDVLPILYAAREAQRRVLVELPTWPAKLWFNFFKRLDLPYSLHCTRVTAITRMLRAGFTAVEVCAYVGHTEEVNVIYRRLRPADVRPIGHRCREVEAWQQIRRWQRRQRRRETRCALARQAGGQRLFCRRGH